MEHTGSVGSRLRVPDSLSALLGERLARLPGEIGEVVFTAAVAGRPPVELIAAVSGSADAVHDALDVAVREGVLVLEGERVRFVHPLLASICYQQAPAEKRRAAHRLLAGTVADVEERARHLALAADGPDAIAAAELDAAADHAAARGATAAGADLSELAAALTAGDDATESRRRRLRAANLHRLAGNLERAVTLLEELLAELPSGLERADVLLELATTRKDDLPKMVALCDEALAAAAGDDARCTRILAYRSWAYLFEADIDAALRDARAALRAAEQVGDPTLLTVAIAQVATVETRAADITPGLLERGLELEDSLAIRLEYNQSPRVALGPKADRYRRAGSRARHPGGTGGRGGDVGQRGASGRLAPQPRQSRLARRSLGSGARADGAGARVLGPDAGAPWRGLHCLPQGAARSGSWPGRRGARIRRARRRDFARAVGPGMGDPRPRRAGTSRAGPREPDRGGASTCDELPGRLFALGYNDPTAPVWADAVEVLLGLGELERARAYLDRHEDCARRTGNPLALACAARCRGLLAAAEGDVDAASESSGASGRRAGGIAISARTRAHAALSGLRPPEGETKGRRARCAGAERDDLQRARRPALGGEGRG